MAECNTSQESGAGTVLALGLVAVAMAIFAWMGFASATGTAKLEAQALADHVALAADDALRGASTIEPCELARQISAKKEAALDTCRIVEQKVFIELHLYRDFSFSTKTLTLSVKASAAAEPTQLHSSKSF